MDQLRTGLTTAFEHYGVADHGETLLLGALVLSVILSLCIYLGTGQDLGGRSLPPGHMGIPFLTDETRNLLTQRDFFTTRVEQYGPLSKGRLFGRNTVFVAVPSEVRRLLAAEHDLVEAFWPSSTRTMLGNGSVSGSYHGTHKKLRRVLNTAFTAKAVRDYLPKVQQLAERFAHSMATLKPARAHRELQYYTFQAVAELVLGFEESWFTGEVGAAIREAWEPYALAMFSLAIPFPGTTFWKGLKARKFLVGKIRESMLQLKKELETMTPDAPRKIAHKLLEAVDDEGKHFSMEQLEDICINVLWAGHDTSSSSLVQLLALLPRHPEVMEKLREEQAKVVKEHGEVMTEAALRDMQYVEAVMKENLRMNVIVAAVPRTTLKTIHLGDKYAVPKGWDISLNLGYTMRNDPTWADAKGPLALDNFYPDRWLDKDNSKSPAYMPFGAGPRLCLGYPLATVEMKVLLATLARGYAWEVENPKEEWLTFPLKVPRNGLPLKFRKV